MDNIQPLGCSVKIYVSDVHRFGTDAVLLAYFAAPKRSDEACDLGTGCGIIPMLWCRTDAPKKITAVDIQPDAVELVRRSVALNGLEGRVEPIQHDLRIPLNGHNGRYSLVTMNPPYKTVTGGVQSLDKGRLMARHEVTCTMYDAAKAAARLLRSGGRFCVCHRPERLVDVMCAMRENGIEPKRLRLVCQRDGAQPNLILAEGKKDSRSGIIVEPTLFIEGQNGEFSEEMKEIYREYNKAKEQL